MFGSKENAIEKLVLKKNWEKIRKSYLNGDAKVQLELAKACAKSKSDDSVNVLISLLNSTDEAVKIESLKSLSLIATDHAVAPLQQLMAQVKPEQTALKAQLQETIVTLRGKR